MVIDRRGDMFFALESKSKNISLTLNPSLKEDSGTPSCLIAYISVHFFRVHQPARKCKNGITFKCSEYIDLTMTFETSENI